MDTRMTGETIRDVRTEPYGDRGLSFAFAAFGLRLGISLVDAGLLEDVVERLPPTSVPVDYADLHHSFRLNIQGRPAERSGAYVAANDPPRRMTAVTERALNDLEGDIAIHVAEFAPQHLFVHAGVVGWRDRAIVLPGASRAGKSTLVAALVEAGATYYSDEYAVFDTQGNVLPYARKLSLRTDIPGEVRRIDYGCDSSLGSRALPPIPVGLIALMTFEQGRTWYGTHMSRASAIMAMCQHTVAIQRRPADAFTVLGHVVRSAPVYQGVRGDADDAARWLLARSGAGVEAF